MKFDFVIGNPPYQEDKDDNARKPPVYNLFMEEAYKIGTGVELITPARFLFDAGQTPKKWNEKMLNDEHLKVLHYEDDGSRVFPNTEIKGGIVITYRDEEKSFGAIRIFTKYDELNSILNKVQNNTGESFSNIIIGAVPYHFTNIVRDRYPEYTEIIGSSFDLRTNILDKLDKLLFFEDIPKDENKYISIFGLINKKRDIRWINKEYVTTPKNFEYYKVLLPKASGNGSFGETLTKPEVIAPFVGHTQSFISIGFCETENEAINLEKYIKTKFFRSLLGVLKTTQDLTSDKFKYIPLQDFTSSSDIDWSKSIHEIDLQLYKKYGLSNEEIDFIEKNVKEMV